jgi:hypothetical protein
MRGWIDQLSSKFLVEGGGASYNYTKSYNKKKTTIFTTQTQVVYF